MKAKAKKSNSVCRTKTAKASNSAYRTKTPRKDFTVHYLDPRTLGTPRVNDVLYGRISDDPDLDGLTDSVRKNGVETPLIVNRDGVIISGNRRCMAACRAGLREVPCFVRDIAETAPDFARLLVDCNENRVKGMDATLKERGMRAAASEPIEWLEMQRLKARRRESAGSIVDSIADRLKRKPPKEIVRARIFADAVIDVVNECHGRGIRPTIRQVHYLLLNNPPIRDTRTGRRYKNDLSSYDALTRVATDLRRNGELPLDAFIDATRQLRNPPTFRNAAEYVNWQLDIFGRDYMHRVMQSQGAYFVVAVEKETQAALFEEHIQHKYPGTPLMVCRGQPSTSLIGDVAAAFKASGKDRMVIVALTDCDPCGKFIARAIGKKLIDDAKLAPDDFCLIEAGLTHEQARRHNAKPQPIKSKGKSGKTIARNFRAAHGTSDVYELEAIPPDALLHILDEAMQGRMDIDAYNAEIAAYESEAANIQRAHRAMLAAFSQGAA